MRRENKKEGYEGKHQSDKMRKKVMRRRKGYPGEEMEEGKEGEKQNQEDWEETGVLCRAEAKEEGTELCIQRNTSFVVHVIVTQEDGNGFTNPCCCDVTQR